MEWSIRPSTQHVLHVVSCKTTTNGGNASQKLLLCVLVMRSAACFPWFCDTVNHHDHRLFGTNSKTTFAMTFVNIYAKLTSMSHQMTTYMTMAFSFLTNISLTSAPPSPTSQTCHVYWMIGTISMTTHFFLNNLLIIEQMNNCFPTSIAHASMLNNVSHINPFLKQYMYNQAKPFSSMGLLVRAKHLFIKHCAITSAQMDTLSPVSCHLALQPSSFQVDTQHTLCLLFQLTVSPKLLYATSIKTQNRLSCSGMFP